MSNFLSIITQVEAIRIYDIFPLERQLSVNIKSTGLGAKTPGFPFPFLCFWH